MRHGSYHSMNVTVPAVPGKHTGGCIGAVGADEDLSVCAGRTSDVTYRLAHCCRWPCESQSRRGGKRRNEHGSGRGGQVAPPAPDIMLIADASCISCLPNRAGGLAGNQRDFLRGETRGRLARGRKILSRGYTRWPKRRVHGKAAFKLAGCRRSRGGKRSGWP